MADTALCRMRLQKYADIGGGLLDIPLHIRAANPDLLTIHIVGIPANAIGFTEASAPTTKIDVATAVVVETISSSADDSQDDADDAQEVRVIHIDEYNKMKNSDLLGHATDWNANPQTSVQLFKEVFHSFVIQWGSTGDRDAAGNVDVRTVGDTVFVQIPAASNESNGSAFKVPDGHVAMLFGGRLTRLAETVDEGVSIRIVYIDAIDGYTGMAAADRLQNYLEFSINGIADSGDAEFVDIPKGFMFTSGTWIHFQHSSLVDAGEYYDLVVNFLIWKK